MKKIVVLFALLCMLMVFQTALADPKCPVLTYNGSAQPLVTCENEECGFFSTDGGNTWVNAIPSAKNGGTTWDIRWYLSDEASAKKLCDQTILPADLKVIVIGGNGSLVYSGGEQTYSGYTLEYEDEFGNFADGDVTFAEDFSTLPGIDTGTYEMGLTAGSFVNTNKNYNVTFEVTDGTFEITPKNLGDKDVRMVTSPSEFNYDGREHSVSVAVFFNGMQLAEFIGAVEEEPSNGETIIEDAEGEVIAEEPAAEAEAPEDEATEETVEEPAVEPAGYYTIDGSSILSASRPGGYGVSVTAVEGGNFTGTASGGWRIVEHNPYDLFRIGN